MRLTDCHNFADFRRLASKRLPGPIFHYIDGAADDEVTYRRNTEAYEQADLVPNVLNGVGNVDTFLGMFGMSRNEAARLPTSATCFNLLKLPNLLVHVDVAVVVDVDVLLSRFLLRPSSRSHLKRNPKVVVHVYQLLQRLRRSSGHEEGAPKESRRSL